MIRRECSWHTRHNRSVLAASIILVLAFVASPVFGQVGPGGAGPSSGNVEFPLTVVPRPLNEAMPLRLLLDMFVLGEEFFGFEENGQLLVPLGLISRLLELGITLDLAQGRAQGFFITENRTFFLDLATRTVVIEGQTFDVPPGAVELQANDIFIDTRLFGQWFPIDLMFEPLTQTLIALPREPLPLQDRLAREALRNRGGGVELRRDFNRLPTPYTLFRPPALNLSLNFVHANSADTQTPDNVNNNADYTALLTGDLLFMNGRLALQGRDGDLISDARFTLERKDAGRRLFSGVRYVEALELSEIVVGDVFSFQVPFVASSREGRGGFISSFPLNSPIEFDRQTFRGELPPGWEVELFRNDILQDFRTSRPDGRYDFIDTPLRFGENTFRFEFFGPQGQRRTEVVSIPVGPSQQSPGTEFFRVSVIQENTRVLPFAEDRQDNGSLSVAVNYERGVTQDISVAMNATGTELTDGRYHTTFGAGIRTALTDLRVLPNTFLRADWTQDLIGGYAVVAGLQTEVAGISLTGEYARFFNFDSDALGVLDDRVNSSTSLRADGAIMTPGFLPDLGYTLRADETRHESGLYDRRISARLGTSIREVLFTNTIDGNFSGGNGTDPATTTSGEFVVRTDLDDGLLFSRTVLDDFRFRGTLDYTLQTERLLTGYLLTGEAQLAEHYSARLDIRRILTGETSTSFRPRISREFGTFSLSANGAFANNGDMALGVGLSLGAVQEPRTGLVVSQPNSVATQGMASIRTFLDLNGNGRFDIGDTPLPGIRFRDAEFAGVVTDAQGIAFVTGLGAYFENVVEIDPRTIEDPFIQPRPGGVDIVPRPGVVAIIDFPFTMVGEIDGFVLVQDGGGVRPVSNVPLELVDSMGNVVAETVSTFDGFYLFDAVFPGQYLVRIEPSAQAQLQLLVPPPAPVEIGPEGTVLSGVDIVLQR